MSMKRPRPARSSPRRAAWQGAHWVRASTRLAIYLRDGLACLWCGRALEDGVALSLDHLVAVAEGGSHAPANLVTCCQPCNLTRGATSRDEWCRRLGGDVAERVPVHIARDLAPYRVRALQIQRERPEWLLALRRRSSTVGGIRAGR